MIESNNLPIEVNANSINESELNKDISNLAQQLISRLSFLLQKRVLFTNSLIFFLFFWLQFASELMINTSFDNIFLKFFFSLF